MDTKNTQAPISFQLRSAYFGTRVSGGLIALSAICILISVLVKLTGLFKLDLSAEKAEVGIKYSMYPIDRANIETNNSERFGISDFVFGRYVFPGTKVIFTVSKTSAVKFRVDFAPTAWFQDVEQVVRESGPSAYTCRYYRRDPISGQQFNEGVSRCPDEQAISKLSFRILDDRKLIGQLLAVRVSTGSSVDLLEARVSDPINAKGRFAEYRAKIGEISAREEFLFVWLFGFGLVGSAFGMVIFFVLQSWRERLMRKKRSAYNQ